MELEIVRTVFHNQTNEVSVYADTKRDTGRYYTVISIFSKEICKEIAQRIALAGLFERNADYIGSFTHKDAMHLVFLYYPESQLMGKDTLCSFAQRKEIALRFSTALAETELVGDLGRLLITEENINLAADGKVYLNYFLNFAQFAASTSQEDFYRDAARFIFMLLSREYAQKYDGQVARYPNELCLMYKKLQNKQFKSHSQIIAFVKALPDTPSERRYGVMKLLDTAEKIRAWVLSRPALFLLAVVVAITLGYLGYQLGRRVITDKQTRDNTVYVGLLDIGEVFLGEEDV